MVHTITTAPVCSDGYIKCMLAFIYTDIMIPRREREKTYVKYLFNSVDMLCGFPDVSVIAVTAWDNVSLWLVMLCPPQSIIICAMCLYP